MFVEFYFTVFHFESCLFIFVLFPSGNEKFIPCGTGGFGVPAPTPPGTPFLGPPGTPPGPPRDPDPPILGLFTLAPKGLPRNPPELSCFVTGHQVVYGGARSVRGVSTGIPPGGVGGGENASFKKWVFRGTGAHLGGGGFGGFRWVTVGGFGRTHPRMTCEAKSSKETTCYAGVLHISYLFLMFIYSFF